MKTAVGSEQLHAAGKIFIGLFCLAAAIAGFRQPVSAEGPGTLHHVHISGQSLSLGIGGDPALSIDPSVNHLMISGGLLTPDFSSLEALRTEGQETIAAGFAEGLTNMLEDAGQPANYDLLVSHSGRNGTVIDDLDWQGGDPYHVFWTGMFSFWKGSLYAAEAGRAYQPEAIAWLQGETDIFVNTELSTYKNALTKLQLAYQFGSHYMTGASNVVPMFIYQTNVLTIEGKARADVPLAQLQTSEENPYIHMVTPIYPFTYDDGLHLTNHSYRHLGGYFAKAYKKVIIDGEPWEPLRPVAADLRHRTVTVDFSVPEPPLVLDTEVVNDPGDYGFEVIDNNGVVSIAAVRLSGPEQVEIVLSRQPVGSSRVRYAYSGPRLADIWGVGGAYVGARGNLRDSDASTGFGLNEQGQPYVLPNWCVAFEMSI